MTLCNTKAAGSPHQSKPEGKKSPCEGGGEKGKQEKIGEKHSVKNKLTEKYEQNLGVIKMFYLNHPQHTRLDTDSATTRLLCEPQAWASRGGSKPASMANVSQPPIEKHEKNTK